MKRLFLLGILLIIVCVAFTYTFDKTITGRVTDENGKPIIATVQVKNTSTSTITDTAGYFTISVPGNTAVLSVSATGYENKEVAVDNSSRLNIILNSPKLALREEVVTDLHKKQLKDFATYPRATGIASSESKTAEIYIQNSRSSAPPATFRGNDAINENWRYNNNFNREGYDHLEEHPFLKVNDNPLSTFSIDVDAASYSNMRRFINDRQLPPAGAIRIEELINYFSYQYSQPVNDEPFNVNTELSACPWNEKHQLILIGLQGKKIPIDHLPTSNLVFLVDVSGSMNEADKLPLVQSSLKLLIDQLRPQDKVALVVYAGNAGLVLPSTMGENKTTIKDAIDRLEAGGSTAGGEGIELAYKTAEANFIKNGNNRVILCTDGDFNVGVSSDDELERLIEEKRKNGVFLTVLGYGTGNYQDAKMQKLADKGNGNHSYIDGISEAKKVLINEFGGTLFTIAKDVKLQIEFNPDKVKAYRLIGYENRLLAKEDFNNDKKDAGELGSGHTVTALYEIIAHGATDEQLDSVDVLRYQKANKIKPANIYTNEILNVKLRYKKPNADVSKMIQHPLFNNPKELKKTSDNLRFAAAVAEFGMLLRESKYKGQATFATVQQLAKTALSNDTEGYRKEFIQLVANTAVLKNSQETTKANP